MPRMDGTGPAGQGPATGLGLGPCGTPSPNTSRTVSRQPGSWLGRVLQTAYGAFGARTYGAGRGGGRGMGAGRGQGRRRRRSLQ